jgi:hypothetical protein
MHPEDDRYFILSLETALQNARTKSEFLKQIVNAPFHDRLRMTNYGIGIVVFLQTNHKTNTVDRLALSDTDPAKGAVRMSAKEFKEIKIPRDHTENIIVKALDTNKPQYTSDWKYLFTPELSAKDARFNQAGAGIDCSFVYPIIDQKNEAALIFSYFEPFREISHEQREFMAGYAKLVGRYIKNSAKPHSKPAS